MRVISVDVGTTGAKVSVFDADGTVRSRAFREYPVDCPRENWAQQDALEVLAAVESLLEEAAKSAGSAPIAAIALSVQGDAVIPVDAADTPLLPVLLGMDYRSAPQSDWCARTFGSRWLFQRTGMQPHPINSLTKMLWVEQERPDIAQRVAKYLTYDSFLLRRLGCEGYYTDASMASRSMACDLQSGQWSRHILTKAGIDAARFPEISPACTAVGTLRPDLTRRLGLAKPPALVLGGHDQTCAAVGAGVIREGMAVDSHGTAEVLSTCFDAVRTGDTMYAGGYPCYRHIVPGKYFTFALNHAGGIVLRWYRDQLGFEERQRAAALGVSAYDLIVEDTGDAPSPLLFLPHFSGSGNPHNDIAARGTIAGLTFASEKRDIARALLEGLAFEMRLNAQIFADMGIHLDSIRCVGGGASSRKSLQIKADVLQTPVSTLAEGEAASLGAAIAALTALGHFSSIAEGSNALVRQRETYEPNAKCAATYNAKFEQYKALYAALRPVYGKG